MNFKMHGQEYIIFSDEFEQMEKERIAAEASKGRGRGRRRGGRRGGNNAARTISSMFAIATASNTGEFAIDLTAGTSTRSSTSRLNRTEPVVVSSDSDSSEVDLHRRQK